jgi:chemotaxis protein CheC
MTLNSDQKDCLQELMNIAFGASTAIIAKIIDKFATLDIPTIETTSSGKLREQLVVKLKNSGAFYLSSQLISGDISGKNIFIIDKDSALNLAHEFDEEEISENEQKDVVLEITNLISSTSSSKLASLIDSTISFSPPTINLVSSINEFDNQFYNDYEHIIVISTLLKFDDQDIQGQLIMMTKKESSVFLKTALDKILDEY